MTAKEISALTIGIALGSILFITINNSKEENIRKYCNSMEEQHIADSLAIEHLRKQLWDKQLLYADTLFIETIIVDGSIVKQRYRNGDSVLRVW